VEGHVKHVHTDVHQWSTAGDRTTSEPAAKSGNALPTEPAGFRVVDIADQTSVDDLLERLHIPPAAVIEHNVQHSVVAFGRLDHPTGGRCILGDWFLREHMYPGVQCGDCDGLMQCGRRRDTDDVELCLVEEVAPVTETVIRGNAVKITQPRQRRWLHAGQRNHIDLRCLRVGRHVLLACPPEADNSHAQRLLISHGRLQY
jgi:hypothetical protein